MLVSSGKTVFCVINPDLEQFREQLLFYKSQFTAAAAFRSHVQMWTLSLERLSASATWCELLHTESRGERDLWT